MLRLKSPGFFQSPVLEAVFGGGENNVALSLANFGVDAAFVTALPDNPLKEERLRAAKIFSGPETRFQGDLDTLIAAVHAALYNSKICAYAQDMALLRAASDEYGCDLDLAEIAQVWGAG